MTTFAAFCGNVQNIVADTSNTMLARIVRWANEYHHQMCGQRKWKWLEKVSDATLIKTSVYPFDLASLKVATVATPADKVLDVVDVDFIPNQSLWDATSDEIRHSWSDDPANTGTPEYWYVESGALKLFPNPTAAGRNYTIRFRAATATYPQASVLPLLVPDKWLHVLENAVVGKVMIWLDDSRAQTFLTLHEKGLVEMKHDDSETDPIVYDQRLPKRTTRLPRLSLDG